MYVSIFLSFYESIQVYIFKIERINWSDSFQKVSIGNDGIDVKTTYTVITRSTLKAYIFKNI
jgi:hypothetical protein